MTATVGEYAGNAYFCRMNPRLFQKEYERLFMPLCMFALRITGDIETARDTVQSAFIAAWERVDLIDHLKAYMYLAVRNAAISFAGDIARYYDMAHAELDDVPQEDIDTSERDARLWTAIDSLPDRCREIFLMSKRDGMSYHDIALELDISEKTVENQISKALNKLRGNGSLSGYSYIWFLPFL